MSPVSTSSNLPRGRQARSRAARAMVREHALRLFLRDGYAATTVETIAEAAGISRRTFFRYFQSKEDVVTARTEEVGLKLGELYRARPLNESPLASMRGAFQPVIAEYARDPVRTRAILRLAQDTVELRARQRDIQALWVGALALEVGRRHPEAGPLFCELLASLAVTALNVAVNRWLADGGDLASLVDQAFGALPAMLATPAP